MPATVPTLRPSFVTEAHLRFLDKARLQHCKMWEMPRYLVQEFAVSPAEASTILQYWMAQFAA